MNVNYFQMQHFITESNWSARELMDQVARDVSATLPKRKLTALIIDESGCIEKVMPKVKPDTNAAEILAYLKGE